MSITLSHDQRIKLASLCFNAYREKQAKPDPPGTRYARNKRESKWGINKNEYRRLAENEDAKDDVEVFTGKNIGGWGLSYYKPEEAEKQAGYWTEALGQLAARVRRTY